MTAEKDEIEKVETEIVPENEDESGGQEAGVLIKKLRERLERAQADKQQYLDLSQRLRADYLNLQKETESARAEFGKYATDALLLELLELADGFDLALGNPEALKNVPDNWRQGMEHLRVRLQTVFRDHDLVEFSPDLNHPFDPTSAQAVEQIPATSETLDHTIVAVIQKGYRLHNKIIRPAKVKVATWQKS